MNNYKRIIQFNLNNNNYNMYLDCKNKHFFLREDSNGNLSYLDFNEFILVVKHIKSIPNLMNIKRDSSKDLKIIPKILIGGTTVVLTSTILMTAFSLYQSQERIKKFEVEYSNDKLSNKEVNNYVSTISSNEVSKSKLIVDTFLESDWLNYLYIYDMDYLDKVFNYSTINIDSLNDVISNNDNISEKYKDILYGYVENSYSKYPNIDYRVFYNNLKTLEVVECEDDELVMETLSMESYGCYVRNENKIYVKKDNNYDKGTWAYQVICHEFSHCLRTGQWNIDGKKVKVQVEGQKFTNMTTAEALNSLFTVSMFDYEELDIAYQLQSNYHKIMIESMDNYSLSDYVNHSVSYYANKLDEFNEDDNYATSMLELIEMQYNDYHSDSINVDKKEYYPLYDYIANMYYKKQLGDNFTYQEIEQATSNLLRQLLYDVPGDYNIDINHFYNYMDTYYTNTILEKDLKMR